MRIYSKVVRGYWVEDDDGNRMIVSVSVQITEHPGIDGKPQIEQGRESHRLPNGHLVIDEDGGALKVHETGRKLRRLPAA